METAESKLNKEYKDYSDFTDEFDKEEKLIDNKFSIKELIENIQHSNLFRIFQKNKNLKIITKYFYMEGYIGLFLHKIIASEKELQKIISYVNNVIKINKEKQGGDYSGMFENIDIIDLQFFLSPESFYNKKVLKDLNIKYEQLSKEPQIYNSHKLWSQMSKRYSGKSFKDASVMKKAKLSFKEKRKLKKEKKIRKNFLT